MLRRRPWATPSASTPVRSNNTATAIMQSRGSEPVAGSSECGCDVALGNPTSDATVDGSMSPVTGSDSSDAAGSVVSDATVGISVGSTGGATSAMTLEEGANDRLTAASTGRGAITAASAAPAHISAPSAGTARTHQKSTLVRVGLRTVMAAQNCQRGRQWNFSRDDRRETGGASACSADGLPRREQLDTTCCSSRAGASTSVAGRPGPPNRTATDLPVGLGASGRSPRAEVAPLATSAGLHSDETTFCHPRVNTFSHPFPLGSGRAERTLAFLCGGAHDRRTHATASRMSAPPLGATSSTHLTLRSGLDPGSSPRERERHLEALTQERGHP